jgi:hypothetical protein
MAALRLYWGLRTRGVWIRVRGAGLHVEGPADDMTPALRADLLAAKPGLLRLLAEPCPCSGCSALDGGASVPRIHCASGLDADAMWEALRREFDALDEADERAAIQAVEGP